MNNLKNQRAVLVETETDFSNYIELPNNNPLAIVDVELKIVYCNEAFKSNFGLGIGEEISKMNSNPEFVYLVKGFNESHYKNISVDITLSFENDTLVKNYFVRIERVFIKLQQYFVLSIESLEQRNKLENKINSIHNALDQGNFPLMILDNDKKITYVSKTFEIVLNRDLENIFNKQIDEVLSDYLNLAELDDLKNSLNNYTPWKKLVCFYKKAPAEYWEFKLNPVYENEFEKPNFILFANNLTEHINQTIAIERSEKKQKLIIDNISDLLLIVEKVGNFALFENANDNFCKSFGLDKNKIYSLKIDDFIPQNLSKEIYEAIFILTTKNVSFHEFIYKHFDNHEFNCKVTSVPESGSNLTYFIITLKDITEEIRYREQLKKAYHKEMQLNKMKSDFLANMSHEIRTPFNAVVGFSEIIDESIESGETEILRELMNSMKEVLGRALNLFTNIIEVSQIESGEIELEKVDLNCNHIIRNLSKKFEEDIQKKDIDFILELSNDDCVIEVDWVKFEKIVSSLLDNAIKYTDKGYVYVGSRIENKFVVIVIEDSGVGIEQSQIERLLKPFTQEIEGYTRPFEGAGLGLTIAYKLTQLMDGKFEIKSEKNKGTRIILTFPLSS
ncbi:PAS domain-containing sensor histidine kinase [Stygiobacter electus]|uniref:histidine kinase n=1 Tax=Stygiobacter electus TaxID=3032292 RepID=A0AAE3NYS5_9BACT|nr:ATP-binding protein [Stygiobacter electus]MDF1611217.1 ATP-binding protein [Stygiobacter electus]